MQAVLPTSTVCNSLVISFLSTFIYLSNLFFGNTSFYNAMAVAITAKHIRRIPFFEMNVMDIQSPKRTWFLQIVSEFSILK